ncbi:hypothetical protein PS652_02861 [Pseudomonas fluorescens]|uniref:Uncharacterized protein n=1 Tax=Pseudomonas fluorescens TaxID=294 RepID=A0A5E6VNS9_PSEFL|nr:hypothetical protein PS652_04254 [Pseudomonas fluorescens]
MDSSVSLVLLKLAAQLVQNTVGRLDVRNLQALRKLVDPRRLKFHCKSEGVFPRVGKHNQLRPAMVRVGLKLQHSLLDQIVDDALNVRDGCV